MKILVTAGPTREPIDPVRFISNRSSGKMGYAVAQAGREHGHEVRLVSGPVALQPPAGVELTSVSTADEMRAAVERSLEWCDALVMAAAVADWRPSRVAANKLKKSSSAPRIELEATPDILKAIASRKGRRLFVGFAAETERVLDEASRKLREKNLDLVVANDVSAPDAGFDVDTNRVTLLSRDGARESLPLLSKHEVADRIVRWIEAQR